MGNGIKKLTTDQKTKASQLHKNLLQPIINHNIDRQRYGEPCVNARTLMQMEEAGLFADDPDGFFGLLNLCLVAECFRQISMQLKKQDTERNSVSGCDVSKLYIGLIVKNYKELCYLLGEDTKTGKAKTIQMKEWSRYFEYEKIINSNQYIILDIYPEPLSKGSKKNTKFVNQLIILILREVIRQNENNKGNMIYYTTYMELIKRMELINKFFYEETQKFFIAKFPEWFRSDSDIEDFK